MKKYLNRLRYNHYFSLLARVLVFPVERICAWSTRQLRMKVWVNGGKVNYDGIALSFPRNVGVHYSSGIFWQGVDGFEPLTWCVIKHYLGTAGVFVDVGANIGMYSVLARKLRPDIRILSFEPVPSIHAKCLAFHKINNCSVEEIFNAAIGDKQGRARMLLPVEAGATEEETTATLRQDSWQNRSSSMEFEVEVTTLDLVFRNFRAGTRVLVKVDVEDFEESVFAGAEAAVAALRPVFVCEILPRPHGNQNTWLMLEKFGYVPFGITKDGLVRFNKQDFFQKRSFTDFLLIHASAVHNCNYVPLGALDQLAVMPPQS